MGSEWDIVILEDIAEVIDSRHKTPQYSEEGYPMVRVVDIKNGQLELEHTKRVAIDVYEDFSKGRDPQIGDLVFSRVGSYGNVAYVSSSEQFCLGQNTALISPKNKDRFLYYALISPQLRLQIENMVVGAVQKTISLKSIKSLEIPCPPEAQRANIVRFLSDLDNKITLNRQINQTLEQMAQTLFKSWFVDFDPVIDNALAAGNPIPDELQPRAEQRKALQLKASGENDSEGGYKPLPESVRALFPDAFEEGELGWVPEGWGVKNLTDLVESVSQTYPLKTVNEVIFLNTGDIENGRFLHREFSSVTGLPGQAKKSIKKGDILFSEIRPKNKRFAFVNFDADNYVVSTKLMVLRSKEEIAPIFSYFLLTMSKNTNELQRIAELRSGTFPQITYKELELINLVLPSDRNIIKLFVSSYLEPFYKQFFSTDSQNETLINLRDTLLPKLISGELQLDQLPDVVESVA